MRELRVRYLSKFTVRISMDGFRSTDIRISIRKDSVELVTDNKVLESVKRLPWIHLNRDYQMELLSYEIIQLLNKADYRKIYQEVFSIKFTDTVNLVREDEIYSAKEFAKRYFKAYDTKYANFKFR